MMDHGNLVRLNDLESQITDFLQTACHWPDC